MNDKIELKQEFQNALTPAPQKDDWLTRCLEDESRLDDPECPLTGRELEMVFISRYLKTRYAVKAGRSVLSKLQTTSFNWTAICCTCRVLADPNRKRKIRVENEEIRQAVRAGYEAREKTK
ncbi:MAG: hypothetical protein J5858_12790 [Lentisphaeria bacterium]|nr:hypothetical protein [Lentisphaeria bacterium]